MSKKKGSILWVIFKKINSWSHFLTFQNILCVNFFLQKRFNSVSHNFWKNQNSFNHVEKRFNSVGHIQEKGSIHWVILKKKSSILWVIFDKIALNSLSHILEIRFEKGSILWVILKKEKFNSSGHIEKRGSISAGEKKGSILWVYFASTKKFDSLSHIQKWVQFIESYSKRGSNLWVQKKKFNSWLIERSSILWVIF